MSLTRRHDGVVTRIKHALRATPAAFDAPRTIGYVAWEQLRLTPDGALEIPEGTSLRRCHGSTRLVRIAENGQGLHATIPWRARPTFRRPRPSETRAGATGTRIASVVHHATPWARAVTGCSRRLRPLGFLETWVSERSGGPSFFIGMLVPVVVVALSGFSLAPAVLAHAYYANYIVGRIPPLHSCLEACFMRSGRRFTRSATFERPVSGGEHAMTVVPEYLVEGVRTPRMSIHDATVKFFDDWLSQRSRLPAFVMGTVLQGLGFLAHVPLPITIAYNEVVGRVPRAVSLPDAWGVYRRTGSWRMALNRILRPTMFDRPEHQLRFGSSVDTVDGTSEHNRGKELGGEPTLRGAVHNVERAESTGPWGRPLPSPRIWVVPSPETAGSGRARITPTSIPVMTSSAAPTSPTTGAMVHMQRALGE